MEKAEVLKEIIETRKSTFPKNYAGGEIEDRVLEEILNSAQFAPQHKRTNPSLFRVFRGAEKDLLGRHLADIYKETVLPQNFLQKKYLDIPEKIGKSAAIITISVNFSGLVPEWEEIASTAMAVQNMYLTCNANQIGCYWSSPGLIQYLNPFLGLGENQKCLGLFYLGNI
ncbi:nitroreductase family protein [Kaistella palustris]|uniref:nitroreductase family protein n=1 Tax=Kaistella palustris TaxID=493376 RepID=UPI000414BDD8|nr:nitroreductase family protein [Kaistella palustris]